jgi:two-component system response regulator EvgA
MLESEGYRVVAEASTGAAALAQARTLEPELMLVDVCLPDIDGFELAARLRSLERPPTVILTTSRDCAELESLAGGCACGVVPKDKLSGAVLEQLLARA